MRDLSICIVGIPYKVDPWNVFFVVELVKMLDQQGHVLISEIDNS
jgi:hypothetical protein